MSFSVVGVVAVLIGAFWPAAAEWLFPGGGVLTVASVFLLSPYLRISSVRKEMVTHASFIHINRSNQSLEPTAGRCEDNI